MSPNSLPNTLIDERIRRQLARHRLGYRGKGRLTNTTRAISLVYGEGLNGESIEAAELLQHYGYTSHPPPGFDLICLPLGGKSKNAVIVATEHGSFRLQGLAAGEVAVYDMHGQKVHLTANGIVIDGAGKPLLVSNVSKARFETQRLECTGDIIDNVASNSLSMAKMRETYNQHTHPGDSGGSTGQPKQGMA